MRMDKLTSRFQQALAMPSRWQLGRDHQFIEPAHVLLALVDGSGGSVRPLLMKAGVDVNKLRAGLLGSLDGLPKVEGTPGEVHVSNDLNRLLNVTDKLAQQRGDQFISSELFVLAAFDDRALAKLLKDAGAVRGRHREGDRGGARRGEGRRCQCGRKPPGAGEVHRRPHRAGLLGQAGSCDRPR